MSRVQHNNAAGGTSQSTSYSDDRAGNVAGVEDPSGRTLYGYDNAGNRTSATLPGGSKLVHEALCAGACGFLLKDAGPGLLVKVVHAAANGEALVSPSITTRLLAHFTATSARRHARRADPALTQRELDVAKAIARGRTNAEITDELTISLSTVKTHLASIQRKIAARNRTEIAVWAWESGLVR